MHRAHASYANRASDDSALIQRHGGLIERMARRLASRTGGAVSPEDLWSAGAMGLVDASRRFDPGREVKFETFAEQRIRGAMLDEMRRMDHLPRRLRAQVERVERARSRATQRLGREARPEEIAAELGLDIEEVESLVLLALPPGSGLAEDLISSLPRPDDQAMRGQTARALAEAVARLPERLQLVLSLHYQDGLSYREIARILDVSEPRICQLHGEAVGLLRRALAPAPPPEAARALAAAESTP
jgi:RNA polymerase sigma factor for flagellar operon FliA